MDYSGKKVVSRYAVREIFNRIPVLTNSDLDKVISKLRQAQYERNTENNKDTVQLGDG